MFCIHRQNLNRQSFVTTQNFWVCLCSTCWGWVWRFMLVSHCVLFSPLRYANFIISSLMLFSTCGMRKYSCRGLLLSWQVPRASTTLSVSLSSVDWYDWSTLFMSSTTVMQRVRSPFFSLGFSVLVLLILTAGSC